MKKENEFRSALRVSQLDSAELDLELFDLLKQQLDAICKYLQPGLLIKYDPEINAALQFLLWKYTINQHDATIGQQLLDLKYSSQRHSSGRLSRPQRAMYAALHIICPWTMARVVPYLRARTSTDEEENQIWLVFRWCELLWKALTIVNFLVFLQRGTYQFVSERLLGIAAVFPKPQGIRQIGFEYLDRELLWHGFSEFLFFIIPLVNYKRLKNLAYRHLMPSRQPRPISEHDRTSEQLMQCAVCEDWPYSPCEGGCVHVFCYYCLQSNLQADEEYICPLCGVQITDMKPVRLKHLI